MHSAVVVCPGLSLASRVWCTVMDLCVPCVHIWLALFFSSAYISSSCNIILSPKPAYLSVHHHFVCEDDVLSIMEKMEAGSFSAL